MRAGEEATRGNLRDLLLLKELTEAGHVSQRSLAESLGMGLGVVNRRIRTFLDAGFIRVVDPSVRPFAYQLTPVGEGHRTRLRHRRYEGVVGELREMQRHIEERLATLKEMGMLRLVFYGSGEVMELTLPLAEAQGLEVVGLVDDDPAKHRISRGGLDVRPPDAVPSLEPDAVLITTFRHAGEIKEKMDPEVRLGLPVMEL